MATGLKRNDRVWVRASRSGPRIKGTILDQGMRGSAYLVHLDTPYKGEVDVFFDTILVERVTALDLLAEI